MPEAVDTPPVGRVLGTDDATPLSFWVALGPDQYLQLDDVVALERRLPDGDTVRIYGLVTQVRARHEGARFDSDVFLIEDGILPAEVSQAAQVLATRFEPEVFVPPLPGQVVYKAEGDERDMALYFDGMEKRLPAGLTRDDEPLYANLEFLDGSRGAHVNISGVSGVATKTTYATFLLFSLFRSGVLGGEQYTIIIHNVVAKLRDAAEGLPDGGIAVDGETITDFAASVADDADLVVVDGPLYRRQHLPRTIGYVKTHRVHYLKGRPAETIAALAEGERTPVFRFRTSWTRNAWYLRLPGPKAHAWSGVVRMEATADLPLDETVALANLTAAVLPRHASKPHKDPRAPQNLYPIAGLERELRRRLGDALYVERALRAAAG